MRKHIVRLLCVLASLGASLAAEAQRPAYVDLRPHQTPVKAQGARGNCFIHGTVAAMEAAYKRQGHGDLDLAEHFSDYVARLLFIETCQFDGRFRTRFMRIPDAWERESGIPMFEHQGGTVDSLVASSPAAVLGLPEERFMPPTDTLFDTGGRPDTDPYWQRQYNVSTHLLDERRLPRSALRAPAYYRVKRVEWLPRADATRPEAIEAILASGREVIWDFRMAGNWDGRIWKYTGPAGDVTTHRMLIVGYDRRDPRNKFFIAKNSWGHPIPNPPGDDFTYIEYDYLKYGEWASWIAEVERPYRMPELAFIGRWDVAFGPHRGTLDVYHVPGLMQPLFDHHLYADERGQRVQDRRLGTFYLNGDPDQPYRVNGALRGEQLEAWIDFDQRAPRWDLLNGWKLVMTLDRAGERMNGRATPPAGRAHDAAATRVPIRTEAPAPAASHTKEEPLTAEAAIHAKWQATGGLDFLGAPVTGVETCPDGLGRYTHYERGSIYWSPRTPPSVIYGAIRDRWAALGWETGPLGYPTSDELDSGDGGRLNTFERGRILWHPHKGAWEELLPEKTDTPDFTTSVI